MRHAGPAALDRLETLLDQIRALGILRERKRGAFYRGPVGWLHFHEDPAGLFADLKIDGEFRRFPVSTAAERVALLRRVRTGLKD